MKKFLLPALLSAMFVAGTSAEVKVTVTPLGDKPVTPVRKEVSTADLLVYQDFSDLTTPYIVGPLSSSTVPQESLNTPIENPYTREVPAELMGGQEGWAAQYAFPNDGTCVIQTYAPGTQYKSYLSTPMNDYSGSLAITFIAQALPTYWYDLNSEGEEVLKRFTGSSIDVSISTASDRDLQLIGGEAYELASVRLYEAQGWCEVKIEVDNLSAYNDTYITFATDEIVELDNIKVTSSVDKFIAAPVLQSVTDVTNTAFTINLEPVRKSFDYWVYLYTLEGFDNDGQPIFQPVMSPQDKADADMMGMTYEEYWEWYLSEWNINDKYSYYGTIDNGTSFTFTDLNPEVQYYFGIRSHYVSTFSDLVIYEQTVLPTPIALQPTNVGSDYFTATWEPVAKADFYYTTLYGIETASETTDDYYILDDNFDKSIGEGTLNNPEELDPADPEVINKYTDMPGWTVYNAYPLVADGAIGICGYYGTLISPELYWRGADIVTVRAKVVGNNPYASGFYLVCGYDYEYCELTEGEWEDELTFSTDGADWGYVQFTDAAGVGLFVEYVSVTRNVTEGENVCTFLQTAYVEEGTTFDYSGLDTDMFTTFGFNVMACQQTQEGYNTSARSEIQTVNLFNGGSSISGIDSQNEAVVEGIYTATGQKVEEMMKGINIIRYTNGTTKKVMVK